MKHKSNAPDNNIVKKLSDEELSKKLGRYQRTETFWTFVALAGIITGVVILFATHKTVVAALIIFGCAMCGVFLGNNAKKKKKELTLQQLGDYFSEEFQKRFGSEQHTKEMIIDEQYMKKANIIDKKWESCEAVSFHEGKYRNACFSAANVELNHELEEKIGPRADDRMSRTIKVFDGIVIKCQTDFSLLSQVTVNERLDEHPCYDISKAENFNARFNVRADNMVDADSFITPELREMIKTLETLTAGKLNGIVMNGNILSLAINTKYSFAEVPDYVDYKDIDSIRKWYVSSLHGMERILDVIMENAVLFNRV